MLDLHPDKFKPLWSRILLAARSEPILRSELAQTVRVRFLKDYSKEVYEAAFDQLEMLGLIERLLTNSGVKIFVTRSGQEHVGMIEYLSKSQPDPYRKLTRPSYSPNCQPEMLASDQVDMFIPAPSGWDKLTTAANEPRSKLPPVNASSCW